MAKYLLHIVDGRAKGERVDLPGNRAFQIGRKKSCDLALDDDEKVSGVHCELVFEGTHVLLRDLESTNGTRVDGKRIQEIPVSHGDRFVVGTTTLELVDAAAGDVVPVDEMGLSIDAEALARSSRRSPVALLLLVAIVAVGGAGWWVFVRSDAPRRRRRQKPVAEVAGNLLSPALAHVESDASGWVPLAAGGAFTKSGGGRTGTGALSADLGGGDTPETGGPSFAVAVPERAFRVEMGAAYEARAWFRTEGDVRVALRICFVPKRPPPAADDAGDEGDGAAASKFTRRPDMVAGTQLAELPGDGYQQLTTRAAAPLGAEEVTVALVAVLAPGRAGAEARVFADDISLVRTSADGVAQSRQVKSRNVFAPDPATCSLRVNDGDVSPLRALSVLPAAATDPALAELAKLLPLPASDLHGRLQMDVGDRGLELTGGGGGRLVLEVGNAALPDGTYWVRKVTAVAGAPDNEQFEVYSGATSHEAVTGLYWGGTLHRVLLRPSRPVRLDVEEGPQPDETRFVLDFPGKVELALVLDAEHAATIDLARRAGAAYDGGEPGKALELYDRLLRTSPFYEKAVRTAELRRSELLTRARKTFERLAADFDEARAFHYEGLYRSLLGRLDALEDMRAAFGTELSDLRRKIQDRLGEVEKEKGELRGARLVEVARALAESDQKRLARLIGGFVIEHFPATDAAKQARAILGEKPGADR